MVEKSNPSTTPISDDVIRSEHSQSEVLLSSKSSSNINGLVLSSSSIKEEKERQGSFATNTSMDSLHKQEIEREQLQFHSFYEKAVEEQTILLPLARQLEYYLSQQNLSKDTYLQTLRSLNDGCVPLSIISNFARVKMILPLPPPLPVATKGQNKDKSTGKKATDETPAKSIKILAIGTKTGEPIDLTTQPSTQAYPLQQQQQQNQYLQNTVILRDVDAQVTESEVRHIFSFENSPSIISVEPDVANSWFVTLNTHSHEEIVHVLMHLQMQLLAGKPINARLRSVPTAVPVDPAPLLYPTYVAMEPNQVSQRVSHKKKKKNIHNVKRKDFDKDKSAKKDGSYQKTNNARNFKRSTKKPPHNKQKSNTKAKKKDDKKTKTVTPPPMSEDHFPTLQDKKVEWETSPADFKDGDDDCLCNKNYYEDGNSSSLKMSDSASTATTTSSSTESHSQPKLSGGYAAALLKSVDSSSKTISSSASESSLSVPPNKVVEKYENSKDSNEAPINTNDNSAKAPNPWGKSNANGRSYADILRANAAKSKD